jgi:DNA-3-methyladenine glycosylase II
MTDPNEMLASDGVLGPVAEDHGPVSLDPAEDLYRRLVVSLVRQPVSMGAAAAIRERLFAEIDVTPAGVLDADPATLQGAGLSEAKTAYAREAARAFRKRGWDHAYFDGMDDEAVKSELTEVRGIGPWTADMFLMFGLGREDVFPVGDLGIRKGMWQLVDEDLTRGEMRDYAGEWAPYRSYASIYLWRAVEG